MTSLTGLLATASRTATGFTTQIPLNWLQGRTAYGGLSSALALAAAKQVEADLPPLRSAQIAFIGPLAGAVSVTATRLRRGRNAAFVQADIVSDAGLGFRAIFVFMTALESKVALDAAPRADHAPPAADANLYTGPPEFFTGNFNFLDLRDAAGPSEWLRWGRLIELAGLDPEIELMAMGDALPPAAFKLFEKMTPLSSLTWQVNVLKPRPVTRDGWWLLHAATETAQNGYSSQRMRMWDADGVLVAEGMQGVAIFG
ncbi:thioesterase family protein [Sphingomonas sp. MG17]|uniref:Thioesterase family protein n=1 Tax=Sphingomonas tagetis TaxID=2949092 RepID=A0A9X2HK97_9SPHN|nr:thioesterase family protein [Sphingomonas tagetis]MCP3730694.1 thioesterase family protein [Sphingomonas tagetis]